MLTNDPLGTAGSMEQPAAHTRCTELKALHTARWELLAGERSRVTGKKRKESLLEESPW